MSSIITLGTSIPKTPFILSKVVSTFLFSCSLPAETSTLTEVTLPAPNLQTRDKALLEALSVVYSSTPFSNLFDESDDLPSVLDDFLTLSLLNFAHSNTTAFVSVFISLLSPPIMPASATGLSPSQITRFSGFKVSSFSSSVTIFSSFFALRTTISLFLRSFSSNACMGCPSSKRT